ENWSSWLMHPGTPPDFSTAKFVDSVAAWHGKTSTFSWADGHAESHRWLDEATTRYALSTDPNKYYSSPPAFAQSPRDLYFLAKGYATQQNPEFSAFRNQYSSTNKPQRPALSAGLSS